MKGDNCSFEIPLDFFTFYSTKSQGYQLIENFKALFPRVNMKNLTITDGTSGIGGNSLFFCKYFGYVNCVEVDKNTAFILNKNLKKYFNKTVIIGNYLEHFQGLKQDVIFLDPPWGEDYINSKRNSSYINLYLSGFDVNHLISLLYDHCKLLILKAPMNFKFKYVNKWSSKRFLIYSNGKIIYYLYFYYKNVR